MKKEIRHNQRDVSLPRVRPQGAGVVRIIAGQWRRTPLPVAQLPGLRPTGDRIRETVFNWLQFLLVDLTEINGLDMFAGSGALGFELASRGAKRVLLFEKNKIAARNLSGIKAKLKANNLEVINGDCLNFLSRSSERFDIIFIDPPFALNYHEKAIEAACKHLNPGALIYVESPADWSCEELFKRFALEIVRDGHAGAVAYRILRKKECEL